MSCPEFIASTMALRTAAHLHHFSTKSYAQHVALGDFYEALTDLIDKYAEIYMGLEGQIPMRSWPAVKPPTDEPALLLENYLEALKDETDEDHGSQALLNVLAELEELTARTLYKLRNLK